MTRSITTIPHRHKLLMLALVLGVLAPPVLFIWYAHEIEHNAIKIQYQADIETSTGVLASGLAPAVWNLIPSLGQPLVDKFIEDSRIRSVEVISKAQGPIIQAGDPKKGDTKHLVVVTRPIVFGDSEIGSVRVTYDLSFIEGDDHSFWGELPLVLIHRPTAEEAPDARLWAKLGWFFLASILTSCLIVYFLVSMFSRVKQAAAIQEGHARLAESEMRLKDIAQNVPGVVFQFHRDALRALTLPYVSPHVTELFGVDDDACMSDASAFFNAFDEDTRAGLLSELHAGIDAGGDWHWVGSIAGADGTPAWVQATAVIRTVDDGSRVVNGHFRDVTEVYETHQSLERAKTGLEFEVADRTEQLLREIDERKKTEAALRKSEERFKDFTETATDWVWEADANCTISFVKVNTAVKVLFDPGPLVGASLADLVAGDEALESMPQAGNFLRDLNKRNGFRGVEFKALGADGSEHRLRINGRPIHDSQGNFIGYRGTGRDITQQTRSQRRLLNLSAAIDTIPEAIAILDSDDRFTFFNRAFVDMNEGAQESLTIGGTFEDHLRHAAARGVIKDARGHEQDWVELRLAHHIDPDGPFELTTKDDSHKYVYEHRLPDGGMLLMAIDVSALKQAERELIAAKEEAEDASAAKSEFLASMSHELRTPLHAILGFAQLLNANRDKDLSPKKLRAVSHIVNSGEHLLKLISDVLDLARIESGQLITDLERTPASELIDSAVDMVRHLAEDRGCELHHVKASSRYLPDVIVDPTRAVQAMVNILMNAIKYGGEGARIDVEVAVADANFLRFSIRDNGPGVPESKKSAVFAAFNRLGMEMSEVEGTGIGLSISKALVEEMGGRIDFESEEGHGAHFWIDLPIAETQSLRAVGV